MKEVNVQEARLIGILFVAIGAICLFAPNSFFFCMVAASYGLLYIVYPHRVFPLKGDVEQQRKKMRTNSLQSSYAAMPWFLSPVLIGLILSVAGVVYAIS